MYLFTRQSKSLLYAFGILLTLVIGVVDYLTGYDIALSVFYLAPICFVVWFVNKKAGIMMSVLSTLTSVSADYLSGKIYKQSFIELWNIALLLCFFLVVVFLLSRLKGEFQERAQLIIELEHAMKDLEQKKDELARSNSELEQFAYVAAHDLRSPLLVVEGYVRLLQRRFNETINDDATQLISHVTDGVCQMRKLIDDLLIYARMGTKETVATLINFNEVIAKAISNLQVDIDQYKAVVSYDQMPTLGANGTQIVELFQNLIGNGMKFTKEAQPRVHISAKEGEGEWVFSVSDNGIGISFDDKDRIFKMFQRLHNKGEFPGTGIGLSICKRIVERHRGHIWVESELGKGSTFHFTLPKGQGVNS